MAPLLRTTPNISKVNARRLLEDLASSYTYSLEEAVLVELIANSLDGQSSNIYIDIDVRGGTLSVEDDGLGMSPDDFEQYHDLAESTKERGGGIGFAGLGAKLGHKVSKTVRTETRSDGYRDASDWAFKRNDLEWRRSRSRSLKDNGTKVVLTISSRSKKMLDELFIRDTIGRHFGVLLDPFMSQVYLWNAIYPDGVVFHLNGVQISKVALLSSHEVQVRQEIDIFGKRKRLAGRAIFVVTENPLPEESQGIAISTYGKLIRRDTLGVTPRRPEHITGWIEAPALVECLTLSKQDFSTTGALGKKHRSIRSQLQKAFVDWLEEIGESRESTEQQRAPKRLERETAEILQRIPALRFLFGSQITESVPTPEPSGDETSTLTGEMQATFGLGEAGPTDGDAPSFVGPDEGAAAVSDPEGQAESRPRRRTVGGGPRIARISDADRAEISWIEGDTVFINTGHPTYQLGVRRNLTGYHERFAIFFALCREAPVEPDEKFNLIELALTEWARS